MSLKVPAIVEEIKNALSQNMCVVIGLQTTGEVRIYCQQNIVLGTNFVDILYFSPALKVR